ncbi:hypothetical protein AB0425_35300 [Actinosynnema sp. NPDC051121]
MHYINRTTGEIIDISPYRLELLREALQVGQRPARLTYLQPGRVSYLRRRRRLSWGHWCQQFTSQLGPVVIGLVLLWVLLGGEVTL